MQKKRGSAVSHTPGTEDLASSPGMCPDRELNPQPFDLQGDVQSTEPDQSGHIAAISLKFHLFFACLFVFELYFCANKPP